MIDKTSALTSAAVSIISPQKNRVFQKLLQLRVLVGTAKTLGRDFYAECFGVPLRDTQLGNGLNQETDR